MLLLLSCPRAFGDGETPWAQGVPADRQHDANALFDEGNQLFAQQRHAPALEKYRAALALWDHPLIHFNTAVTLIRLERWLEAADELDHALRWGQTPFTPELYQQALDYKKLLEGRVGTVAADCTQAGVHVTLDGKPWFECPAAKTQRVTMGEHAVGGERKDFLTTSQRVAVMGGATKSVRVELVPLDSAIRLVYPIRRWVPWTVTAIGVAAALGGAAFYVTGRSGIDQFDSDYAATCGAAGCEPGLTRHHELADELDRAKLEGTMGLSMMAVGGAAVVTGVVLFIVDRPRRVLPNVEVAPLAGGAATTIGWSF